MLDKDTFNDYSLSLVDIVDLVQSEMIKKISRQLGRGKSLEDGDWKLLMLDSIGKLDESLDKIIVSSIPSQADEVLKIQQKAINEGLKDTDAELSTTGEVQSPNSFKTLNKDLLNTVAEKLNTDIANSNLTMLSQSKLDYVKNINDILAVQEVGGLSRTEATRKILKQWSNKGVPSLVDSLGRRWQPDAYVNMVVRTNSMEIARKTQERRAIDYGKDLILTSQHSDQSPEHAPYANKVFSLSGNDPKYPPFSKALSAGFMSRPNCRHTYSFYLPGVSNKPKKQTGTTKNYKVSQEQRKLERKIRAQKREIESLKAGGFDTGAESAKLRDYQADMRTFIDDSGRTRQRDREQI